MDVADEVSRALDHLQEAETILKDVRRAVPDTSALHLRLVETVRAIRGHRNQVAKSLEEYGE